MTNGYLLDSQVLVWLVEKPNRIGRRTWQILRFEELFYSTVSIAELGFKSRAARLNFSKFDVQQWQETGIQELSFGRSPAFEFASFAPHQVPDPMDRQIMATARANGLTLLTSDRKILDLNLDWVLDATT